MTTKTTTAAIYLRLSEDDSGTGTGVANQLAECRAFIDRQEGWTVGEIYEDNSISATKDKTTRPAFERMLKDGPETVVVWRQERLERGYHDALDRFIFAGCTGYTCDGRTITFDMATDELVTRILSSINRYEGRQKVERQKLAYKGEHKRGLPRLSRPVFGNNLDGTWKEDEAKAIISGARDFLNKDASLNEIAARWNAANLRTPFSQSKKSKLQGTKGRGGNLWDHRRIAELFRSERLIGKRTYNGSTVQLVNWTPVLDETTFLNLQAVLDERKTGRRGKKFLPSGSHLLSSILRCDECGGPMVTAYSKNRRLYRCQTVRHFDADGNDIGGQLSKSAEQTEAVVVDDFLLLLTSPSTQEELMGNAGDMADLVAKRASTILRHREWVADALSLEEPPSASFVAQKEAAHEKALKAINAQILDLDKDSLFSGLRFDPIGKSMGQMQADLTAVETDAKQRWEAVPMERKRRIVETFYKRISASRGKKGQKFQRATIKLVPTELLTTLKEKERRSMTDQVP